MINYGEVQRVYRLEKNTPTLTEVPNDFFAQAAALVDSVEEVHRESLSRFFSEIIANRRRKIILQAIRTEDAGMPPANVTPLESDFYREVVGVIVRHKQTLISQKAVQPPPEVERRPEETERVRVLRALPALVGPSGESLGPFREGDVVELPVENAGILIEKKVAEAVEGV
jgi:DNA replication initiation complex subunit (GINS family)